MTKGEKPSAPYGRIRGVMQTVRDENQWRRAGGEERLEHNPRWSTDSGTNTA